MQYMADTTSYAHTFLQHIINGLPVLIGALVLFIVGWLVAKVVATAVHKLLDSAHLNQHLHSGQGGNMLQRMIPDPAGLVATVVFWVILWFAISLAISVLGVPALIDFLRAIYAYLPNVLAAFLIFVAASLISTGIARLIRDTMGGTPTGKVVGTAAPVLVMIIAVFMILNQLRIAPAIVTITYAALLGGTALGMALAFGLGGRDVAARMLQDLYEKGQQHKTQVAVDIKHGASQVRRRNDGSPNRAS